MIYKKKKNTFQKFFNEFDKQFKKNKFLKQVESNIN